MLIKWLNADGTPRHGGAGRWHLPRGKRPGKWMPPVAVKPCESGYHVCTPLQALNWIGPAAFEVEVRGEIVDADNKTVAAEARLLRRLHWDAQIARHYACDCAERALAHIAEPDPRSVNAISAARRFADGLATRDDLDAAWDAAWDAASAAAWDAARDAAWAAAWAAARAAARDAARAAASAAARAAEHEWQSTRLLDYLERGMAARTEAKP